MSGPVRRGIPFVVSGPSGAGKTSLLRRALADDPKLRFSVSHTTRAPRPGEVDGTDYHFVDAKTFREEASRGVFLESAEYQGNLYGTSRRTIEEATRAGVDLILEVEIQGAAQLRQRLPEAVFIFIVPPSMEMLEARLRGRGTDPEEVVQKRMARALEEMRAFSSYDYVVENTEFESAVADLLTVIRAARQRTALHVDSLRRRFRLD